MLKIGARWRDCPPEYGLYTTIYNRFHHWSRQGVWFAVFETLTGYSGVWGSIAIDSTSAKVRRSAAGAKGGLCEASAPRGADEPARYTA
jgi:transposase